MSIRWMLLILGPASSIGNRTQWLCRLHLKVSGVIQQIQVQGEGLLSAMQHLKCVPTVQGCATSLADTMRTP